MAGTYEIPVEGSPNTTEEPKIKTMLTGLNAMLGAGNKLEGKEIVSGSITGTQIASATVEDSDLASPNNSAYRSVLNGAGFMPAAAAANTYFLSSSGLIGASGGNLVEGATRRIPPFFYFDSADYTVAGKTQKLRLRAQAAVNATKPTIKITLGLYPITVAGGAEALTMTLGTVVSGSTVEFNEPTASTVSQGNSGDLTVPSAGAFVLGVITSGTLTANSTVLLSAQLQTRSV